MSSQCKLLHLLIISILSLSFYSYFHCSIPLAPQRIDERPTISPDFDLTPSNFTLTIKVLAYNRIASITRCLHSLSHADYGNDRVNLHIFIDHFTKSNRGDETEVINKEIKQSHKILVLADNFIWKFGEKFVHYRSVNVGLQAQWLESWWPNSDDEFAFVVEDDLELSPFYYRYLKGLISNFYYNSNNFNAAIYGASLQRPRFVAGKHGNRLKVDNTTRLFLYQMVGTWGQLLFPKPWKEFRIWYDTHKAKGMKPFLDGMVTSGWYKKMGDRIWTPWFIKFIHSHGYYNIYTNFLNARALSVSHRDAGVNYGRGVGPDSQLIDKVPLDVNFWDMPPLKTLKWYDFCFREVNPYRIVKTISGLGFFLESVQIQKTVIALSLYRSSGPVIRNLLCHLERLNVRNYVLIGVEPSSIPDLAKRGHSVIETDSLVMDAERHGLVKFLDDRSSSLEKEFLGKGIVIMKCLEIGYNPWIIDGNMIPVESFLQMQEDNYDLLVGKEMELMYVFNTGSSKMLWSYDFVGKIALHGKSLGNGSSLLIDQSNFAFLAARHCEESGLQVRRVDELSFSFKMDNANSNSTHLSGKKMVFWSSSALSLQSIQQQLTDMKLWVIDEELSCSAVVCHSN